MNYPSLQDKQGNILQDSLIIPCRLQKNTILVLLQNINYYTFLVFHVARQESSLSGWQAQFSETEKITFRQE